MNFDSTNKLILKISEIKAPTLFLMVGLPYSGKSYLSKTISEKLSIDRISLDETWVSMSKTVKNIDWQFVNDSNLIS